MITRHLTLNIRLKIFQPSSISLIGIWLLRRIPILLRYCDRIFSTLKINTWHLIWTCWSATYGPQLCNQSLLHEHRYSPSIWAQMKYPFPKQRMLTLSWSHDRLLWAENMSVYILSVYCVVSVRLSYYRLYIIALSNFC